MQMAWRGPGFDSTSPSSSRFRTHSWSTVCIGPGWASISPPSKRSVTHWCRFWDPGRKGHLSFSKILDESNRWQARWWDTPKSPEPIPRAGWLNLINNLPFFLFKKLLKGGAPRTTHPFRIIPSSPFLWLIPTKPGLNSFLNAKPILGKPEGRQQGFPLKLPSRLLSLSAWPVVNFGTQRMWGLHFSASYCHHRFPTWPCNQDTKIGGDCKIWEPVLKWVLISTRTISDD